MLSALVPASENAFELLLMPRLIGDLVFQAHFESDVPEGLPLAEPLVVVHDRLFLGGVAPVANPRRPPSMATQMSVKTRQVPPRRR